MEKPLGKRVRRDPNVRIAEEEEKRNRAQLASNGNKLPVKNPTRFVPDAPGFTPLNKHDIRADLQAVERDDTMIMDECDCLPALPPHMNLVVDKTAKPPLGSDSSIIKKKMRFASWIQHPETIQSDLSKYRKTVSVLKREYAELLGAEDQYLNAMQTCRHELLSGLSTMRDECSQMQLIRNAIGDRILEVCEFDKKINFETALSARPVGTLAKDFLDEACNIHADYVTELDNYISLANGLLETLNNEGRMDASVAAPSSKRAKRGQAASSTITVELPIPVLDINAEEEEGGRRASAGYVRRLLGKRIKGNDKEQAVVDAIPEGDMETCDNVACESTTTRMNLRRTRNSDNEDPTALSVSLVSCLSRAEDQSRHLQSNSVAELISDLITTTTEVPDGETGFIWSSKNSMTDSDCILRLKELFLSSTSANFSSNAGASRWKVGKKKSRSTGATAVNMTAPLLLPCPRGMPLVLSNAGLMPDRCVGTAAATADGREGSSLASACCGSTSEIMDRELVEENVLALRGRIIAAEVFLSKLRADVKNWQVLMTDVEETLEYVKERHKDTVEYSAADAAAIRAELQGLDTSGMVVTENSSSCRRNDLGGDIANQRAGFFKFSADDADFFSSKTVSLKSQGGGKSKGKKVKRGGSSLRNQLSILPSSVMPSEATEESPSSPMPEASQTSFIEDMDNTCKLAKSSQQQRTGDKASVDGNIIRTEELAGEVSPPKTSKSLRSKRTV